MSTKARTKVLPSSTTSAAESAVRALAAAAGHPAECARLRDLLSANPTAVRALNAAGFKKTIGGEIEEIEPAPPAGAGGEEKEQQEQEKKAVAVDTPHHQEQETDLPPELRAFTILKEMPDVRAVLNRAPFVDAQRSLQDAPGDPAALAALREQDPSGVRVACSSVRGLHHRELDIAMLMAGVLTMQGIAATRPDFNVGGTARDILLAGMDPGRK